MVMASHLIFLFALGACVGSFLNVVVWRLPRGESLVLPPSRCPKCEHRLAWYDNIPIFGWLLLAGKCRYCKEKISPRYPIVELITALIFVGCYLLLFVAQFGPTPATTSFVRSSTGVSVRMLNPADHWPLLVLYLFTLSSLLAASLIDLELFIIPLEIPYLLAG
ncbi:MAG TPA: prepilin peptidase, partial [Tepidisphaeraceae bacterium]|nr:prepilin peptidase [Tepidisphaeraceae bacterium]